MRIKFSFKGDGLTKLQKKLQGYDDKIIVAIREANEKSSRELIKIARQNLKLNGTDDTGRLRGSLAVLDTELQGLVYNTGTDVEYSEGIEIGTAPHRLNGGEMQNLKEWAKRKLKVPANKLYIATLSISNHIAEDGTDAQPFLAPASVEVKPKHRKNVAAAIKDFNRKL